LIHAARAVVKNDKRVGDDVRVSQLDDEMAAAAASGAGRKIGVKVDVRSRTIPGAIGDLLSGYSWLRS
jgi:hypothetical protein